MNQSKNVLIVAYLFPPIGGGGVQRALKMAKYLGQFGWNVHVLTVEPTYHVSLDESLLEQLPDDVQIHRAKEWQLWKRRPVTPRKTSLPQSRSRHNKKHLFNILKKIKHALLIPDDQILWYPHAIRHGLQVMKQHQIDMIFSTSGPYTNHLVGRYLKRKTGKPWIADFRDPWTQNMHRFGPAWRERVEEWMERSVMREADCIVTVTPSFANNFMRKFSSEIKRMEVIHNGFDREDYEELEKISSSRQDRQQTGQYGDDDERIRSRTKADRCTFIYTGIFYQERNPRILLQAVKELIDEGKVPRDRIVLQFAGVFDYPGYTENQDCVRTLQLDDIVEVLGHLPHRQALLAMKKADVLMLIGDTAPESGDYIPGKLYEYMAIEKPILALTMPGEAANIIERFQLGEIADPTSIEQIKAAFLKMYQQWEQSELATGQDTGLKNREAIRIYERKEQARMLAQCMDELVDG